MATTITGIVYLDMLQQFLIPQLDEDYQEGRIYFQQDSSPSHYLGEEPENFNAHFLARWTGIAATAIPGSYTPGFFVMGLR
jgi:hypothetical protein